MPNSNDMKAHAARPALVSALADHIAGVIHQAVASRGAATLVLSGGTTPADLFAVLDGMDLPWDKVSLTLSDERWVDLDDPASNEAMVRRTLATALAKGARLVGLKSPGAAAADGLEATHGRVATLDRPFDLVLLGMGEDGHTASFFPGGEGLEQALSGNGGLAVAGVVPAIPGPARITLTRPVLLDSRVIILLITGETKRRVLDQALVPGPVEVLPVRSVLHQDLVPVSIWWAP